MNNYYKLEDRLLVLMVTLGSFAAVVAISACVVVAFGYEKEALYTLCSSLVILMGAFVCLFYFVRMTNRRRPGKKARMKIDEALKPAE